MPIASIVEHKRVKRGSAGFTLIELLVVTGITAMIMLTATSMFATFLLSSARTNARRQLQAEGNEAIRRIEFVIRNAASVPTCTAADDISLSTLNNKTATITWDSGTNSLLLDDDISVNPAAARITSDSVIVSVLGSSIFTCTTVNSAQYVDVSFRLQPAASAEYSTIAQDFKTTIQIRNTSF